jgi:hypothetical protein
MKILTIVLLLTIGLGTPAAFGQKRNEPFEKTNTDARKVIQFMTVWENLSNKHDVAALDKLLPADLVITFQDGQVQTRDEYITALRNNPSDFTITDYDQKVDLYADHNAAIARARYVVAVSKDVKLDFRYTVTFLKRKGRWEPVAFHSSPLTPQK